VITRKWNRPQSQFIKAKERLIDFEGGVRSGKTTAGIWKLINYAIEHPGIKMLLARWTGDALNMQLKPKFYEECPKELLGKWHGKEEVQDFTNGSMLYIRSLKSSDDAARFAKFTGLTLGVIMVDQPEEMPEDIYHALKGRLSQAGFPQQMILTPNPPAMTHWLVDEFPEANTIEGHLYLRTSLYDNRGIIGEEYIRELEREYPEGHVMRRRMIDGRRGLSIEGDAVYGSVFSRDLHVRDVEFFPDYPLYESWDFGHKHPAVSWHQLLPWGHWNILGEYMGSEQFIDETVPVVSALRNELFPGVTTLYVCCDPAGAQGQGARHTCVEVLNSHLRKVYGPNMGARYMTNANRPEQRAWAIQQVSSHMTRLLRGRPACVVHSRCILIADGFEAGYVYDDRAILTGSRLPNFRRPRKDGTYDHLQNTIEYFQLNYSGSVVEQVDVSKMSVRERLHHLQRDTDESDSWNIRRNVSRSRAGY
jgi:hypothetical protein